MHCKILKSDFGICKVNALSDVDLTKLSGVFFLGNMEDEVSLVCEYHQVPKNAKGSDAFWRGFYLDGVLDFSLVGILAKISGILAENGISIFAVSTYNTDTIFTKKEDFSAAIAVLAKHGYEFTE